MKKERYIYFIFILFIVVNFISCKNFLNGSDTKNKLDEYINYVNDTNPLIIKNVFPEYISEGVYKTTPIRIQFNKPIDTSTFKYNFSNSNEYFDEPVYSNSNRVVTFFPKIDNDEKFTFLDVTLVIDDNIKSSSGTKIHLENNEYKIRYNNSVDKIKPVINNIEISKDRDFEHNSLSQNNSMFNDNDDDELSKYRINKLWIKAKGIDYNYGRSRKKYDFRYNFISKRN